MELQMHHAHHVPGLTRDLVLRSKQEAPDQVRGG